MSLTVLASFLSISLGLAGALIGVGMLLQRVKTLESQAKVPNGPTIALQEQIKVANKRIQDLEADRKEHGQLLSKLGAEWEGMKEAMNGLKAAMVALAQKMDEKA